MTARAPLINIVDLPVERIYVRLSATYLQRTLVKLKRKYGSKRKIAYNLGVKWPTFRDWFAQRYFMPLWFAIKYNKELNISLKSLEENIVEYKGKGTSHIIKNPILPLNRTQELFNIVGHFIGDGFITSKNVGYVNLNKKLLDSMETRMKDAFGYMKILYSHSLAGIPTIIFPRITGQIIKHIFKMDFRCKKTRISNIILNATINEKAAFIRALFDDDGSIRRSEITLYSANYYLLKDVQNLLDSMNIKSNVRKMSKNRDYYVLYILTDFILNFSKLIGFEHTEKKLKLERLIAKRFKKCELTM